MVGAALGVVALGAGPALAHARLIGSDPKQGATLRTPPQRVVLTFSEPVSRDSSLLTVSEPGRRSVTAGAPTFDGAVVTQPLQALPAAGRYTIAYLIRSLDGHRISGRRTFTYAPAASPVAPATSPATSAATTAPATGPAATPGDPPTSAAAASAPAQAVPVSTTSGGTSGLVTWGIAGLGAVLVAGLVALAWLSRRRPPRADQT